MVTPYQGNALIEPLTERLRHSGRLVGYSVETHLSETIFIPMGGPKAMRNSSIATIGLRPPPGRCGSAKGV